MMSHVLQTKIVCVIWNLTLGAANGFNLSRTNQMREQGG
jgi:hypothetical protein